MENFIAKIEGHGKLEIDWKKNKVKLQVHEGERLFEGILVNRTAGEMAWITPRICGVCPVAHNLASLRAVEDALNIKISRETEMLRQLLDCGQMIQSHVLHLFFLSLPDYLGIDRGTELAAKKPSLFKDAMFLKEVSDLMVKTVGGRAVHPMRSAIGGFNKVPSKAQLQRLLKKIEKAEKAAENTAELCAAIEWPELEVGLELAAQKEDKIVVVSSKNIKGRKESFIRSYKKDIEEEIRDYSTAKFGKYRGREMLVGSLARLAVYNNYDKKYKLDFANPFYNNFAQALEIVYYLKQAGELAGKLLGIKLDAKVMKPGRNPALKGIGAIEAPRGGLYHEVHLESSASPGVNSIITEANIITPTVQNLTSIEKSAQIFLDKSKNRSKKEIERLMTMLVRAYDPCITCSVH